MNASDAPMNSSSSPMTSSSATIHSSGSPLKPIRHVVLITYGEPPRPRFGDQLKYSWRILLGLTRSVAPIPAFVLPIIALQRARFRVSLWRKEKYESPLEPITRAQARGLGEALAAQAPEIEWRVHVAYEFRDPLLPAMLDSIPPGESVDVLPMYVADSAFTHEISRRTVAEWLERRFPAGRPAPVRVVMGPDAEEFATIAAGFVLRQIKARRIGGSDWALVLAAHGTLMNPPKPYETGRVATEQIAAMIGEHTAGSFGIAQIGWLNHVYGGKWTEPSADLALRGVAELKYEKVVYFPFGFAADNAESQLEGRIALRTQPRLEAQHLPCLNDAPDYMQALARCVIRSGGLTGMGGTGSRADADRRLSSMNPEPKVRSASS